MATPPVDIDSLTRPITIDEATTAIYNILATTGVTTTTWKPGAVVRTIIAGVAVVFAALSQLIAAIAKCGFLDLAEGDWLTLIAFYVYGVTRISATFATGVVTLTNAGGATYDLDPGDLVVASSANGRSYTNSAVIHLVGSSTLTGVAIVALEAGSASTAFGGEIATMVTGLSGVTVTNPAAVVGVDAEADAALRLRCREKLGALSPNGPLDAYAFVARSATRADGTSIGVTRVRAVKDGMGGLDVYVATADGAVTGTVTDVTTDLGAVDDAMQRQATPLAITLRTHSATVVAINVSYAIYLYNNSGLTNSQIEAKISAALLAFMKAQPVGGNVVGVDVGRVYLEGIKTAIMGAVPQIFNVALVTPVGDVALTADQVPTPGTIVASLIVPVAAPEVS